MLSRTFDVPCARFLHVHGDFFSLAQCVHIRTSMRGYARWRPQGCL